jgi:hypothetical protein
VADAKTGVDPDELEQLMIDRDLKRKTIDELEQKLKKSNTAEDLEGAFNNIAGSNEQIDLSKATLEIQKTKEVAEKEKKITLKEQLKKEKDEALSKLNSIDASTPDEDPAKMELQNKIKGLDKKMEETDNQINQLDSNIKTIESELKEMDELSSIEKRIIAEQATLDKEMEEKLLKEEIDSLQREIVKGEKEIEAIGSMGMDEFVELVKNAENAFGKMATDSSTIFCVDNISLISTDNLSIFVHDNLSLASYDSLTVLGKAEMTPTTAPAKDLMQKFRENNVKKRKRRS